MLSATAGALLAVSLSSTPLLQSRLSPEEQAIFNQGQLASTNMRLPELTRPVNILVVGTKVLTSDLDKEPNKDLGYHALVNSLDGLADTLLLIRFDPKENKLAVLSIPRDTRAWIEETGYTKINDANYFGGPALTAKTVSEVLGGVGIDRYIRVNVQGLEKLVDALGGVTVQVPYDMKYQDDSQHLYINLKAGEQHLDGEEALQFLRFRHDGLGDIGRIQRQQILMRALMEQAMTPKTLVRMPKLIDAVRDHIDTNLTVEELVALAGFATDVDRDKIQMLMLPGDFNNPGEYDGLSYWLPDYDRIDEMMARHFDRNSELQDWYAQEDIDPAYLRVAIQDSSDDAEATDALIAELLDEGYTGAYIDRSWDYPVETTSIIAQNGNAEMARQLQRDLGFGEVRVESTGNLRSDITIRIGRDWVRRYYRLFNERSTTIEDDRSSDRYD